MARFKTSSGAEKKKWDTYRTCKDLFFLLAGFVLYFAVILSVACCVAVFFGDVQRNNNLDVIVRQAEDSGDSIVRDIRGNVVQVNVPDNKNTTSRCDSITYIVNIGVIELLYL